MPDRIVVAGFESCPELCREAQWPSTNRTRGGSFDVVSGGWFRRNLRLVATLTTGLVGLLALETFLLVVVVTPSAFTWWLLGALQAGMVVAYLHLLHSGFLANDREAIWHLRGSWGEDNTRSELRRAKRKRLIWGWVDSITLQNGDLDHFVVTRRGGLVVIDTKWRNQANDTLDMARAAKKAKRRAEAVAHSLYRLEGRARHRSKSTPLPVTPVVVLWGAAKHSLPDHAQLEGIDFIPAATSSHGLSASTTKPSPRLPPTT